MIYTKLTIDTTVEAIDMVSYTLAELGVEGIEVDDKLPLTEEDKQAMFIDILPEQTEEYDGFAKISCYIPMTDTDVAPQSKMSSCDVASLDSAPNYDEGASLGESFAEHGIHNISELIMNIQAELDKLSDFMDVGPKTVTVDHADDADWLYKWKEYFKPFRLEDDIVIKPTWEHLEDAAPEDIIIEIDPGIAFGTGSHNTTKLCIRQLKKYITPESTVLDAGCGSGILSIIALKLGAKEALGIDIDEIAVKVSEENREQNHISTEAFVVRQGDVIGDPQFAASFDKQYDIVVANILADVIIPLSGVVAPLMKADGVFITSGIINTKEEAVRDALLQNGFRIEETTYMGDWVSFTAKKQGRSF